MKKKNTFTVHPMVTQTYSEHIKKLNSLSSSGFESDLDASFKTKLSSSIMKNHIYA